MADHYGGVGPTVAHAAAVILLAILLALVAIVAAKVEHPQAGGVSQSSIPTDPR